MTKYGFYSAVEDYFDKEKKRVVVRARQRQDLENLIELGIGGITKESIVEDRTADYRYRIFITKADWANILAAEASQIDYNNFKSEVSTVDKQHAAAYGQVWHVLYDLQLNEPEV